MRSSFSCFRPDSGLCYPGMGKSTAVRGVVKCRGRAFWVRSGYFAGSENGREHDGFIAPFGAGPGKSRERGRERERTFGPQSVFCTSTGERPGTVSGRERATVAQVSVGDCHPPIPHQPRRTEALRPPRRRRTLPLAAAPAQTTSAHRKPEGKKKCPRKWSGDACLT